jgi:hypothetical protein
VATFKDTKGREWTIAVNAFTAGDVKKRCGVDLFNLAGVDGKFKPLTDLFGDVMMLVDVVFVLCQKQAEEASISDEEFGRSLAEDVILEARNALGNALVEGLPGKGRREVLRRLLELGKKAEDRLTERGLQAMEGTSFDENLDRMIDEMLRRKPAKDANEKAAEIPAAQ